MEKNSTFEKRKIAQTNKLQKFCHVLQTNTNSWYQSNKIVTFSSEKKWLLKLRHHQSNLRFCLRQFQTLQQVYSDHKGEAPLDAPLEADGKPGVDKVALSISSSSSREDSRKHVEYDK